ncbi:lipoyl(octanoyl) transferase LipB [Glacieibacterium frigidum]|uniref:Octanoyltransferase n=1 Tax=Glacieibacterium frigidum TaxID=2593303 RepID=A0A552U7Z6_9SPHN|nr:lipoyl(octanoyl) transferase LipB [Glacieibacterium frigidum]TRW14344.1 lipoyl(octanoyl) transferase LipB [Glacieibacterium frigidum]
MEWRVEPGLVDYRHALAVMDARVEAIRAGTADELIWLVEHPPLYTAGTSAAPAELLDARFPVFASGRGGRYTYHGPGQRVVYVMIDLDRRGRDLRAYVAALEAWVIAALARLGVTALTAPGRIGVWVPTSVGEAKIAALGVRVRRWVTSHGVAINVAPDLAHFGGIVPCGLEGFAVTSLAALGGKADMPAVDDALRASVPSLIDLARTAAPL